MVLIGGGFGGLLRGGAPAPAQESPSVRIIEKPAAISAGPGTGTAIPGWHSATSSPISTCPILEELGLPSRRRSTAFGAGDLQDHCEGDRAEVRPLPRRPASRPRSPRAPLGRGLRHAGSSPPNRGDAHPCALRECWPTAFSRRRPSSRAFPASRAFGGTASTPARWDFDYTGGDSQRKSFTSWLGQARGHHRHRRHRGAVHPPPGAAGAEHLYVFQRTPSSVGVRAQPHPRTPSGRRVPRARLAPEAHGQLPASLVSPAAFQEEDLVNDGWTDIVRKVLALHVAGRRMASDSSPEAIDRQVELADFHEHGGDPRAGGLPS